METKFYQRKNGEFETDGGEGSTVAYPCKFLMARKNKMWFFATDKGEMIEDEPHSYHDVFDRAVMFGTWVETDWPRDWPQIKE